MNTRKYNAVVKTLMLVMLIAVLAATLSACSVFNSIFKTADNSGSDAKVTEVSVVAGDGLAESGGEYSATLGKTFTLTAVLNEDAPSSVTCVWSYGKKGEDKTVISGSTDKSINFILETYNADGYTFTVKVNNVASTNEFDVSTLYASLDDVAISSTSDTIYTGVIQRKIVNLSAIELSVGWNDRFMSPDEECAVAWYVGGSFVAASTTKTFSYTPESSAGDTAIRVRVTCGTKYKEATLTVSVIEKYNQIDEVGLTLTGATAFGTGALTQYKQIGASGSAVTVTADYTPSEGVNYSASVKWTLKNKNGTSVLTDTDNEVTFTPAYGENYVTAEVENVVSRHVVVIQLNSSDFSSAQEQVEYAYVWRGGVYNSYITSQDDFDAFVAYMVSRKITASGSSDTEHVYAYKAASYFTVGSDSMSSALGNLDEAGQFLLAGFTSGSNSYLYLQTSRPVTDVNGNPVYEDGAAKTIVSYFGNPTSNYSPAANVNQAENVVLHYSLIAEADRRTSLPIDSRTAYPYAITSSDMLYRAVGWGYKPTFDSSANGVKLQNLYNDARAALLENIPDGATDFEKVRIIYEWIAQKTDYDYAIVSTDLTTQERICYNAFFLEGVFSNADGDGHGQAVCDGRAKAFVLLCGMEGITALRLSGTATVGDSSEGHAWNKVLVDTDGDGVKEWYACDTTWGDRSSSGDVEKLTMQYFLVTDSYISSTHHADDGQYDPAAVTTFNSYAVSVVDNDGDSFDMYIDSHTELSTAVAYAKTNNVYLDLKVKSSVAANRTAFSNEVKSYAGFGTSFDYFVLDEANGLYLIHVYTG